MPCNQRSGLSSFRNWNGELAVNRLERLIVSSSDEKRRISLPTDRKSARLGERRGEKKRPGGVQAFPAIYGGFVRRVQW